MKRPDCIFPFEHYVADEAQENHIITSIVAYLVNDLLTYLKHSSIDMPVEVESAEEMGILLARIASKFDILIVQDGRDRLIFKLNLEDEKKLSLFGTLSLQAKIGPDKEITSVGLTRRGETVYYFMHLGRWIARSGRGELLWMLSRHDDFDLGQSQTYCDPLTKRMYSVINNSPFRTPLTDYRNLYFLQPNPLQSTPTAPIPPLQFFAGGYVLNFLWINQSPQSPSDLPSNIFGQNGSDVPISSIRAWCIKNPKAVVQVWYDGSLCTPEAIKQTSNQLSELSEKQGNKIFFSDIRRLNVMRQFICEELFKPEVPVYFRVDLIKHIILDWNMSEKNPPSCCIYVDLDVVPMGPDQLFNDKVRKKLQSRGLLGGHWIGDLFTVENSLIMINPHHPVATLHHQLLWLFVFKSGISLGHVESDTFYNLFFINLVLCCRAGVINFESPPSKFKEKNWPKTDPRSELNHLLTGSTLKGRSHPYLFLPLAHVRGYKGVLDELKSLERFQKTSLVQARCG